ncbi:MAG: oxaloacetate decarboxylase [Limisphaerales bacterium]|nr:carboxyvinyl-carboxyphosphonate phosphorylmutase [Pedosphaera sp.]MBL6843763.1 isocitrate lyase/PEP mutase family protein [Verrucomicrobiae bacterium]HAR00643.1 carboxyvinyl-carboxyphosphonate phosphorylmutase [Verrucomicrobiales bacterium]HAW02783.1 carboxyvinyl-carboxyphosphonate phosphorylmutase [Verrucomicrobiales bacterium]HBP56518.1 carboxyvinyl-carboxyphosphonate phosphorylmutase [Verrucomicrobiales bacterium]|tara:strand:- start:1614 stop:2504 length:891 start_codon:yes stop_codon:yes gene_type:complete
MQRKVKQKDKNRALRSLLNDPGIIVSLGVHDAFSALIAQHAGFNLLFLGGFGVSASRFGLPDLNFLNLSDMELAVQQITRQLSIPLIADGDTGHGNLPHVRQTVERLAAAGASGILLEDQLFPKKCGHFHQKQIITKEEMLGKIEVAVDSRPDEDFVIIARTDARALNGLEDAIDRVNAYCELGADVAFIEAPESCAELERIAGRVSYPLFANMLVGGKTPILSVSDLERLGYKIAVSPIETLMVCGSAMQSMMKALKQTGQLTHHLEDKMSFDTLKDILNLDGLLNTQKCHQRVQ